MDENKLTLKLTAITVKIHDHHTSFFAEFPDIVSKGETQEESVENLFSTVNDVFQMRRDEELLLLKEDGRSYRLKVCNFTIK